MAVLIRKGMFGPSVYKLGVTEHILQQTILPPVLRNSSPRRTPILRRNGFVLCRRHFLHDLRSFRPLHPP